jgi:hypothetical protein
MGACLVSDSKILIVGGASEYRGSNNQIYTMDLLNGRTENLTTLNDVVWTTMPAYYNNGSLYFFISGEEKNNVPTVKSFNINVPF